MSIGYYHLRVPYPSLIELTMTEKGLLMFGEVDINPKLSEIIKLIFFTAVEPLKLPLALGLLHFYSCSSTVVLLLLGYI